MQPLNRHGMVGAAFDDPNLIADSGLVPIVALAEQIGLPELVVENVAIVDADNAAGANPHAKVMSLVAGMAARADSIDDIDRLRHAGNRFVVGEMRAPSTVGTFLRAFTHGHVQQPNNVHRAVLVGLMQRMNLLPGSDQVVFVDLDSTHRDVYGYAKQGGEGEGDHSVWLGQSPAVLHGQPDELVCQLPEGEYGAVVDFGWHGPFLNGVPCHARRRVQDRQDSRR